MEKSDSIKSLAIAMCKAQEISLDLRRDVLLDRRK